jgi:hypothetical protein
MGSTPIETLAAMWGCSKAAAGNWKVFECLFDGSAGEKVLLIAAQARLFWRQPIWAMGERLQDLSPVGASIPNHAWFVNSSGLCRQPWSGLARAGPPSPLMQIFVPMCIKKEPARQRLGLLVTMLSRRECGGLVER